MFLVPSQTSPQTEQPTQPYILPEVISELSIITNIYPISHKAGELPGVLSQPDLQRKISSKKALPKEPQPPPPTPTSAFLGYCYGQNTFQQKKNSPKSKINLPCHDLGGKCFRKYYILIERGVCVALDGLNPNPPVSTSQVLG